MIVASSWGGKNGCWLLLSTWTERIKLIGDDVWWVIALSSRPLVLLSGLVWSFIYTPFCSGFSGQFSHLFIVNKLQSEAQICGTRVEWRERPLGWLLLWKKKGGKKKKVKPLQPPRLIHVWQQRREKVKWLTGWSRARARGELTDWKTATWVEGDHYIVKVKGGGGAF